MQAGFEFLDFKGDVKHRGHGARSEWEPNSDGGELEQVVALTNCGSYGQAAATVRSAARKRAERERGFC